MSVFVYPLVQGEQPMRFILTLLMLCLLILPSVSFAQDDDRCDFNSIRSEFARQLSEATSIEDLEQLNADLTFALASCSADVEQLTKDAEHIIKNPEGTGLRDQDVIAVSAGTETVILRFNLNEFNKTRQANADFALISCHLWERGFITQTFEFTATMNGGEQTAVEMVLLPSAQDEVDCEDVENISMTLYADTYNIHSDLNPTPTPRPELPYDVVYLSGTRYVNTTMANVRSGPGDSYDVIGTVSDGETIVLTGLSNDWYGFQFEGTVGWIYNTLTIGIDPSTANRFELNVANVPGVKSVRSAFISEIGDGIFPYLEIDTLPGYTDVSMAQTLYQIALIEVNTAYGSGTSFEFSVILWDGENPAISWLWDNRGNEWSTLR